MSEITSWIIASVTGLLCSVMGWLFTAGAAKLFFYILLFSFIEARGAWGMINRQHNKTDPLSAFPSQFSPHLFFFSCVSLMQMRGACPAWLTLPSLVKAQKIGWNNTASTATKLKGWFTLGVDEQHYLGHKTFNFWKVDNSYASKQQSLIILWHMPYAT